jgi:hypothetical protein
MPALTTVNKIEGLITGLSRKVGQKLIRLMENLRQMNEVT